MTTHGYLLAVYSQVAAPNGQAAMLRPGRARAILALVRARRIRCVGAVIRDADGRLLFIKRGHAPGAGLWSLPGGHVLAGEGDHEAVRREVKEETGLTVAPGALVGSVERPAPDGGVLEIHDYEAAVIGGVLRAGDDAADARWVGPADLVALPLTAGLAEALAAWHVLPGEGVQPRAGPVSDVSDGDPSPGVR